MIIIRKGRFYDIYRLEVEKEVGNKMLGQLILEKFSELKEIDLEDHGNRERILVNGEPAEVSRNIKLGDTITALIDKPHRTAYVQGEDLPLDIVYEDKHLLVVNKAAGMVVHPGPGNWSGTLANALVARYPNLPRQPKGQDKPGIVHRIDKETSGLLVCAKEEKTMEELSKQFYKHTTERTYYALIWGIPKHEYGTIHGDIKRDIYNKKLRNVVEEGMGGKYAITHFRVLQTMQHLSLVQCNLETGRTHQIRVHFNHIGHPLFADKLYGNRKIICGKQDQAFKPLAEKLLQIMPRQALHAKSLEFTHPITKKRLSFESELPSDFQQVLDLLKQQ